MPTKAESSNFLDGRGGEVLSYKGKLTQCFLRVYSPQKEGYDSLKIEGAEDIETACRADVSMSFWTYSPSQRKEFLRSH